MKNLKLKKVILPILLIAVLGGVGYITTTRIIKKENAKKIALINKQKADEKKAYDKKVADEKAIADAKVIEDAKVKAIEDAKIVPPDVVQDDVFGTGIIDEKLVYDMMHRMINTKIIAEDDLTWNNVDITAEGLDKLIKTINNNNYADKTKLLAFIKAWKNKDFSDGVAQHQYFWNLLDGDLGKAIGLK